MSRKEKRSKAVPDVKDILESVPSEFDFGYCSVKSNTTRSFTITNLTAGIVKFLIRKHENCPFVLSHESGVLAVKGKQEIGISYLPQEWESIASSIILSINGEEKTIKLSSVSKYPLLSVSETSLDFKELLVGKSDSKDITIQNTGLVPALFKIEKELSEEDDSSFSVSIKKGQIQPGESVTVSFKFQPKLVGVCSNAHYTVRSKGGNFISVSWYGVGIGYDVHLSAKSMNFGEVSKGNSTNRIVNVVNDSDLATSFQFLVDHRNVFSYSITEGVVAARGSIRVIITFTPQDTIWYYERIFCLIRNHKLLYLDLMGTWYDEDVKPLPLMQLHVDGFRDKVIMGKHYTIKEIKDDVSNHMESNLEEDTKFQFEIPEDDPNHVMHKEMFLENDSNYRDITLNMQFIDFGYWEYGKSSEANKIIIENRMPYRVEVKWTILDVLNSQGEKTDNPYKVDESVMIIDAKSSANFVIKFRPFEPDYYFFQILQWFVYLLNGNEKKMRRQEGGGNPQSVMMTKGKITRTSKFEESMYEEIDPPLWLNLRCIGHSFNPGSQSFIPIVKFLPMKNVVFPPCGPGESKYQILKIMNTSDTPVYYKMIQDSSKVFRIYPLLGLIPGKSFALVCFEFSPKSANHWSFTSQCVLNYMFTNVQNIHLSGKCFRPQITLGNKGKLFFPPTYTGVSTEQKLMIKNETRIPLEYECLVPAKHQEIIMFDPPKGVLQANEERMVTCIFTPLLKKEYSLSIVMQVTNIIDTVKELIGYFNPGSGVAIKAEPKREQTKYELRVFGVGNDGILSIKPSKLDYDTVTVGFSKILSLVVVNKSKTNLYIDFQLEQMNIENKSQEEQDNIRNILYENFSLDFNEGIVPALSKKRVKITFRPSLRFDYNIRFTCNAREKPVQELMASIKQNSYLSQKYSINIVAKGDYPLLRFADIRNDQMSVSNLWEKFQLTPLNKELLTELRTEEIEYSNSEKTNQSVQDLQK